MPFQFTFALPNVFSNPFASTSTVGLHTLDEQVQVQEGLQIRQHLHPTLASSDAANHSDGLTSRKRGWEPSYASTSALPTTMTITTGGYLDTPAKYRTLASQSITHLEGEELLDAMVDDLRPAKRRKTVTESIVSTAYSAALISTAVGYTVYRLWRDRGKAPENEEPGQMEAPPPPYDEGWMQQPNGDLPPPSDRSPKVTQFTRRARPIIVGRPRRRPKKVQSKSPSSSLKKPSFLPPGPYTDPTDIPSDDQETDGLECQMASMSQRLARLIEEGQRALGKEVVVLSESQEDEVDDGSGQWVEEEPQGSRNRPRSNSVPNPSPLSRFSPIPRVGHGQQTPPQTPRGHRRGAQSYPHSRWKARGQGLPPNLDMSTEDTVLLEI